MSSIPTRIALLLSASAAIALASAAPAQAQDLDIPCSTARLIVPFAAGGHSDINARIVEQAMNAQGIQPAIQVVNVTGQSGNAGAKEALNAAPDGCTLLFTHQSIVSAYLTGRVDFTWSDFEPVGNFSTTPVIIGAASEAPFNDLASLEAYATANPDTVLAGVTLGSTSHFSVAGVATLLNIRLRYVSYDATPERVQALLGNVIHLGELTEGTARQYVNTGELQALAILADERSPRLPEVPTAKELGYDFSLGNSLGIVMPAGTPPEIVAHYEEALRAATEDPEVRAQVENIGSYVDFMDSETYAAWWADTFESWKQMAEFVGIYQPQE